MSVVSLISSFFTLLFKQQEGMFAAYNEVRADDNDTNYAVFKYDGAKIVLSEKGTDYDAFLAHFTGTYWLFLFYFCSGCPR